MSNSPPAPLFSKKGEKTLGKSINSLVAIIPSPSNSPIHRIGTLPKLVEGEKTSLGSAPLRPILGEGVGGMRVKTLYHYNIPIR